MSFTYESKQFYLKGTNDDSSDSSAHTTDEDLTIDSAEVRWVGNSDSVNFSKDNSKTAANVGPGDTPVTKTVSIPTFDSIWNHGANNGGFRTANLTGTDTNGEMDVTIELYDENGNFVTDRTDTYDVSGSQLLSPPDDISGGHAEVTLEQLYGVTVDFEFDFTAETITYYDGTAAKNLSVDINSGGGSASYSGSIDDGETTNWISVTGFKEGTNNFAHNLLGSVDWQFRYTATYDAPTRKDEIRVYVHSNDSVERIPLVDPADSLLQYDLVHVYDHTDATVWAVDLVDTDHPQASRFSVAHPTEGELAIREYNV